MEVWTIRDKLDDRTLAQVTLAHTWYRPPAAGRRSEVVTLPCDHQGPTWKDESGVICAEVIYDDPMSRVEDGPWVHLARSRVSCLFGNRQEFPVA